MKHVALKPVPTSLAAPCCPASMPKVPGFRFVFFDRESANLGDRPLPDRFFSIPGPLELFLDLGSKKREVCQEFFMAATLAVFRLPGGKSQEPGDHRQIEAVEKSAVEKEGVALAALRIA